MKDYMKDDMTLQEQLSFFRKMEERSARKKLPKQALGFIVLVVLFLLVASTEVPH